MFIIAVGEGLGQALQYSTIQVASTRLPATPLMDSISTHLLHVVRLDSDPANGVVDHLLPSRSKVQMLMLRCELSVSHPLILAR